MDHDNSRKETVYTRRQVEDLIAQGRTIIIVDGKVLRVDSWLKYHPGGDKAILHVVGRDATDEVNAYVLFAHPPSNSTSYIFVKAPLLRSTATNELLPDWQS